MSNEILEKLRKIVIDLEVDRADELTKEAIASGVDPLQCAGALSKGIKEVGVLFGRKEYFLPELVAASKVMQTALPIVNEEILRTGKKIESIGTVVIGTVAGDIHSIGKDMVSTLLFASGFAVFDLGVDVSTEKFILAVKEHNADILAMSALLSTTIAEQRNVITKLNQEGVRDQVKVIIGGAPLTQEFADSIGADGYGATAVEGVGIAKKLLGINE